MKVVFLDWKKGLKKISLTKLFQNELNLTLHGAKDYVDRFLEGEKITIELTDQESAQQFASKANELGTVAEVI